MLRFEKSHSRLTIDRRRKKLRTIDFERFVILSDRIFFIAYWHKVVGKSGKCRRWKNDMIIAIDITENIKDDRGPGLYRCMRVLSHLDWAVCLDSRAHLQATEEECWFYLKKRADWIHEQTQTDPDFFTRFNFHRLLTWYKTHYSECER
jgi:hypothetical protein